MRCIALAQAWQDRGGEVTFISHCESETLRQRIMNEGFGFISVENAHPNHNDLSQTLEFLKQPSALNLRPSVAWLVLDGYHFTPEYQKAVRDAGIQLLVIDDMNHLPYYHADILLNQNIHAPDLKYHCDEDTTPLLGARYVLLRREFLKYRDLNRQIPDRVKNILVTLGGADPDNVTLKVIKALNLIGDPNIEVKIVVGAANQNIERLQNELSLSPFPFHLLPNVNNMAELMLWADVAVSAAGSTCWEMAFMGLPTSIIVIADNQIRIADELSNVGAGINWGWHENITSKQYTQIVTEIMQDKSKRSCLAEQGKRLVDGKGRQRIIGAMLAGQIKLRIAQENDCKLLWEWANDPEVRQSAFNSNNIEWEDHQVWFLNKQNETDCIQYIALSKNDVPIGQIRFDIKGSIAEIDYSIGKDFRRMGLGQMLLKKGIELFCAQQERSITIQGYVKKENAPSSRTFLSAGFIELRENDFAENVVADTRTHIIYQIEKG